MLPLTFRFLTIMIAHGINERMARRVDYLLEEVLVLKESLRAMTGTTRIRFTPEQRRRLARKGKQLTPEERRACCQIVRPETILARQLAAQKYNGSKNRKPGRPRKAVDIWRLVLKLASDNPGWGYTKIRDALRGLKIEIGRTTVADVLAEAGVEPAPERRRQRTWKQFLRSHAETLYACDFFGVEVLSLFGTVRTLAFFVMHVKSRAVRIAGVRVAPDGAWMKQLARNLLDSEDGFLRDGSYLIHDRDPLFTEAWTAIFKTAGVACLPIPAQSPNCKDYASYCTPLARCDATLMEARLCHSYLAGASSPGAS
jgi:hypothetical protein